MQIRRSELEDRIHSLIQLLEEKLDWPKVFEMRCDRFATWASSMEERLVFKQRALLDDVVRRLSGPLADELKSKQNEFNWIMMHGPELDADKVLEIEQMWKRLNETWEEELRRLKQLPADLDGLNNSLTELMVWLSQVEATLNAPLTVATCDKQSVDANMSEHLELEKSIEQKSPIVSSVLNLCESFTSNYTLLHGWLGADLDSVQCAMQSLQRRWGFICHLAAERRSLLHLLWPEWESVLEITTRLDLDLCAIEIAIPAQDTVTSSALEVEQLDSQLDAIIQQLHSPSLRQQLDHMNEKYILLARASRVDAAGQLQHCVSRVNARWRELSGRVSTSLQTARNASSSVHHWQVSYGSVLHDLSNIIIIFTFIIVV